MYMTEREVIRSYRTAKNPEKQIEILAQLNGVSKKRITAIIATDFTTIKEVETVKKIPEGYKPVREQKKSRGGKNIMAAERKKNQITEAVYAALMEQLTAKKEQIKAIEKKIQASADTIDQIQRDHDEIKMFLEQSEVV